MHQENHEAHDVANGTEDEDDWEQVAVDYLATRNVIFVACNAHSCVSGNDERLFLQSQVTEVPSWLTIFCFYFSVWYFRGRNSLLTNVVTPY